MLGSVINAKKKYYPQTILEECKYDLKRIKIENLIDDDLKKVTLMMKQILILIIMNLMNNLLKVF